MNERIKELSLQATDSIPDDVSAEHAMYLFQVKFAELIVKECADTVLGFHNQFGDSAHNEIREHFGVES